MSTSSQLVDGLQPSTHYYFAVRSLCETSGERSAYSVEADVTTSAAGDTTVPAVQITSPTSNSTYTSARTVTIQTNSSDNVGVTKVELYDGSTLKSTLTSGATSYGWAITGADNGQHSWTAKAYDAAGNTGTSSAVRLNVDIQAADTTKPTVSISSPASGASYSSAQTVTIRASASDNVGVSKVELYDGSSLKATLTSGYSYNWAISAADNGRHSWTAKAYDAAGNSQTSTAVSVTVDIQTGTAACSGSTIWPDSAKPAKLLQDSDTNAVELGVKFRSDTSGYVCGVRFYKGGTGNGGQHVGRLWSIDGDLLAEAAFTDESSSGWQQVDFASPVAIQAGMTYVASYNAPQGRYSLDSRYFTSTSVDSSNLHALRSGSEGGNGVYRYGTGGFPNATYYDSNYWVDVVFMTSSGGSDTEAPTVSITSPAAGTTYRTAQTVTVQATASDNVGVSKIEFYDGSSLKTTLTSGDSYGWAITAADNGQHSWTAKAYDAAGNSRTSTAVAVTVNVPVPDTTKPTVSISSPETGATYSSAQTVTVRASASDNVGVSKVELYDGASLKATLTSGDSYGWAITAADNGQHSWTAKAYDAAGNSQTSTPVSVTVDIGTTAPLACSGSTIWPDSAKPANLVEYTDTAAVELGVKFRSDIDGFICGVRFYKGGTRNGGNHVGHLWTSGGELLAEATFEDETSSGWQQVDFASPVAIQADTVYVVSYNAPQGGYAWDTSYFSSQGVDSSTLHALRSDWRSGNGVYRYGDGGFPTSTWNDSNYWVDVVFTTDSGEGSSDVQSEGMVPGVLDFGEVSVGDAWTWVEFQQDFADPIVVATPPSSSGSDPAVVRVDTSEADAGGFWIRLQHWDYVPNPGQAQERVSYMVVERGHQQLSDGTWIEAGSLETDRVNRFQWVDFEEGFAEAPVVLTSVASANGRDAVTTRARKINGSGFEVGMDEEEGSDQSHVAERVDYVAWERSWGDIAGMHYEAGVVPDAVSDSHYTFVYPTVFEETPFFLAGMQTTNGGDTATLRCDDMASDAADLWVEEEQSKDTETRHVGESVGYILIVPTQP